MLKNMMKKAQMNSEVLKWILMIIIFAIMVVVIIFLQQGLPETVTGIISKLGKLI